MAKGKPTQRAPDVWDSAWFSNIFPWTVRQDRLALGGFAQPKKLKRVVILRRKKYDGH